MNKLDKLLLKLTLEEKGYILDKLIEEDALWTEEGYNKSQ